MPVRVRRYVKASKGPCWEYDLWGRHTDGTKFRERRKSQLATRNATQRFGEARLAAILTAGPDSGRAGAPTFDELWPRYFDKWCVAKGNRTSTREAKRDNYNNHLRAKIGRLRVDAINAEIVDGLKAPFANRQSTGNNILTVINTMLTCAIEYGLIASMPVKIRWFKRRRVERPFYEAHQYELLLTKARALDARIYAAILLAGDGGLRRGEILALEQTDIDYERGFVTIERQQRRGVVGPPKGGVAGTIPTTHRLLAALRSIRHLQGARVLYSDGGLPVDESTIRRWLSRAQRQANLKESGPHILRHTAISHMVMRGVNVRAIQAFARHADLKSTIVYMHLAPGHLEEAVRGTTAPVKGLLRVVPENVHEEA